MNKPYIASLDLVHCPVTEKTTWSFIWLVMSDGIVGWGEATWGRNPGLLAGYHAAVRKQVVGARVGCVGQSGVDRKHAALSGAPCRHLERTGTGDVGYPR